MTIKRMACLLIAVLLAVMLFSTTVSAETVPMTWKTGEKAYISIIIDDNNTELRRMYDLITGEYGFPLCVAVPVRSFDPSLHPVGNPSSLALLHEIENHGGEILSHTLTHKVFNSSVSWSEVDYELGESYRRLTAEGFNVNGVILAGGGGTEDTSEAYRAQIEQYTAKYYKYSDYYGVSTQYYHPRKWMYNSYRRMKNEIDKAIANKSWDVIAAHGIDLEISTNTEQNVRMILDYLKKKEAEGVLEVVTYKEAHEKHATWSGNVDFGDTKYTVDFYDADQTTLLASQVVIEGAAATAPAVSAPAGMEFNGWNVPINNVTDNMKVYAQYSPVATTTTKAPAPLSTTVITQALPITSTQTQTAITQESVTTTAFTAGTTVSQAVTTTVALLPETTTTALVTTTAAVLPTDANVETWPYFVWGGGALALVGVGVGVVILMKKRSKQ